MGLGSFAFGGVVGLFTMATMVELTNVYSSPSDEFNESIANETITMDQRIDYIKTKSVHALCEYEDTREWREEVKDGTSKDDVEICTKNLGAALNQSLLQSSLQINP